MLRDIIMGIASGLASGLIVAGVSEWRFRARQTKMFIKEIVESFLKLRKEAKNGQVHELYYLQLSGILLLKKETDANEVLKQIELRDRALNIPNFIREKGILQSLRMAIENGIRIEDSREIAIQEIAELIKA